MQIPVDLIELLLPLWHRDTTKGEKSDAKRPMETSFIEIEVILVILLIILISIIFRFFILLINVIIMSSNRLAVRASRGRTRSRRNILKICPVYTSLGPGVV